MFKKTRLPSPDPLLVFCFLALILLGTIMVFSSSAILANNKLDDPFYYLKRHLMFLTIGLAAGYGASVINPDFWRKKWFVLYAVTLLILALTLVFGKSLGGAKRWLYIGPVGFQGSELAKFVLIVSLARYIDRYLSKLNSIPHGLIYPLFIFAPLSCLILMEPDLGNPIVLGLIFITLLLVSPISWRYLFVWPSLALPPLAYLIVKTPYRLIRLLTFIKLWKGSPETMGGQGASYQISQALLALGSGGLLGKGLGDSELKLHYLPQPHTDFIFPIIGEELGFIGSLIVIFLFGLLTVRGLRAAIRCDKLFQKMLAAGITFSFVFQAAIHMAVTTALAPTKGMTLPFLSYGGSSLVVSCLMAGVLLRLSRVKKI